MILKKNQIKLFNKIIKFIKGNENTLLIEGEAGSGKTSTISYTLEKLISKNFLKKNTFFFLTPTNAAKKVLFNTIIKNLEKNPVSYDKYKVNSNVLFKTIHSFFNSIQQFDEDGNEFFKLSWKNNAIKDYNKRQMELKEIDPKYIIKEKFILIIDECSMLDELKIKLFKKLTYFYNVKIIFMGDKNQLSYISDDKDKDKNDFLSPIFNLKNKFILKGNVRTNNKSITKIINRSKKSVINNKFNFKLIKSDFQDENVKLISHRDIKKYKDFILKNNPKFITYSNKKKNYINNEIRSMIHENNPYYNHYLYLENEQIIFDKNYHIEGGVSIYNTDEFILQNVKYNIIEEISFLNFLKKTFTIQILEIKTENDNIIKFKQIKKNEIENFIDIIKTLKVCIKDFFYYNPLNEGFISNNKECSFCEEKKNLFKKINKNYICNSCYLKIRNEIKKTHDNLHEEKQFDNEYLKQKIYDTFYKGIQDIHDNYNLPINYSYSITCYKSQGSTYPSVVVDYKNIYNCNYNNVQNLTRSMYVSFSRTKDKLLIMDYIKKS